MSVLNRLLALLLGLFLLGVGVLASVESVLVGMDRPGWFLQRRAWDELLRGLTWEHRGLMLSAAFVLLVGIALLAVQLWPGTPSRLRLAKATPDRRATIDGRGLKEVLRRRAVEDEDVFVATVRLRRRRARVTVSAPPDAKGAEVRARVREKLRKRIDDLQLEKRLRVKVAVRRAKARVR